jgi:hypothetical protein
MRRKLVWIELLGFGGFGCSECSWRFEPSNGPKGISFDEMKENFGLQRNQEFVSHRCADHPKETRQEQSDDV